MGFAMVFPWFSHVPMVYQRGIHPMRAEVRQEMCAVRSRLEALEKLEVGSGQGFFFVRDFGHEKWWFHNICITICDICDICDIYIYIHKNGFTTVSLSKMVVQLLQMGGFATYR